MLHFETVEPNAFSILNRLMSLPELQDFSLVGGTALSLLYGHRSSVDLDLFSNKSFDNIEIAKGVSKEFGKGFENRITNPHFGIFCFINNVKVDIVRHPHPLIRPQLIFDNIRMFSTEDIIAMKVQALLGRGKKKDFWDIAELLQHYSVEDLINFHKEKYVTQNLLITVPQVLTYFADADEGEDPNSLKKQTWKSIQDFMQRRVAEYLS